MILFQTITSRIVGFFVYDFLKLDIVMQQYLVKTDLAKNHPFL